MRRWHIARLFALVLAALLLCGALTRSASAQTPHSDDLSTPRRALAVFVEATNQADWPRALQVLDVGPNASSERRQRALDLAVQLDYILSRQLALDLDQVSDQVTGELADGVDTEQVVRLSLQGRGVAVLLTRLDNPTRWVFSRGTLARVPQLYAAYGPGPVEARMPAKLRVELWGMARWQWLGLLAAVLGALVAGRIAISLARLLVARLVARSKALWDDQLLRALRAPGQLLLALLAFAPLAQLLALPATVWLTCLRVMQVLGTIALTWMAIRVVNLVSRTLELRALSRELGTGPTRLSVRGVQTRLRVLRRVVSWVLVLCAAALLLMQFEVVRSVGISLLASAGVAGIVLGLAAQRTLGSLFAGIQLSISQPIRIGDEVVVEGEFGVIEEITLTYVVVKVWDERRLIVPMTRFLEQPFQNWTKVSSELHGSVMLYTSFTLPLGELRREVDRLLAQSKRWDGRTKVVHVTDMREQALEVRVLVSAGSGGQLFDLRAELREGLVTWLAQFDGGKHLPRWRVLDSTPDSGVSALESAQERRRRGAPLA